MGVPSFFRWLLEKYPRCVSYAQERGRPETCDNLYLDMNGLVHPCCHPMKGPKPRNEDEMFRNVMMYIDRIVRITGPKRLIYMAIDGVAPRAKMNQQRSRRFKAAQDRCEKQKVEERLRKQWQGPESSLPDPKPESWDHNVITPGTPFMMRLSEAIQFYVRDRLSNDPRWRNLEVIFSDASVPGEGEHKIMEHVRCQRTQPGYNPNWKHILHGMDADLIMLGLATHEVNFSILRELVQFGRDKPCDNCNKKGHFSSQCTEPPFESDVLEILSTEFHIVRLSILREYLSYELKPREAIKKFEWNAERAIDDFIFLCFFVGNDFIPHLPSLDIREGALEDLILLYKDNLVKGDGFLTDNGKLNLSRVNLLLNEVGKIEQRVFQERRATKKRIAGKKRRRGAHQEASNDATTSASAASSFEDALKHEMESRNRAPENAGLIELGHEESWRQKYYQEKLDFGKEEVQQRLDPFKSFIKSYIEGLCWVMLYYYEGCPSWSWYYPYHYAPLASDLQHLNEFSDIAFQKSTPFSPISQLMAVMPPASSSCIPEPYRELMTDPASPIKDMYPTSFELDFNGKMWVWQAVVLLPFLDEQRLLSALESRRHLLNPDELFRDTEGYTYLFVSTSHSLANSISALYLRDCTPLEHKESIPLQQSQALSGLISPCENPVDPGAEIASFVPGIPPIRSCRAVAALFFEPYSSIPCNLVLPGAREPGHQLRLHDLNAPHSRRRFGSRGIISPHFNDKQSAR